MDKAQKEQVKLQKKKEKERIRRRKKINNGLDLCLIAACFLTCLAASVLKIVRGDAE